MSSLEHAHGRVLPAWVWLAVGAVFLVLVAALGTAPGLPWAISAPLIALLALTTTLVGVLWRRRRGLVPWFEIGVVYASIVTLYGAYALTKFLVVGEHYQAIEYDARWVLLDPSLAEVAYVGWTYAFHLAAFVTAYVIVRGRTPLSGRPVTPPGTAAFIAVVGLYVCVQAFFLYLGLFYDTTARSYAESYLVSRRLPLVLAQLLNHLGGAVYPLSLVMMAGLFARFASTKYYIAGWIALVAVMTLIQRGGRTELALLVIAAGMMYHMLVRPMAPRTIVVGVVGGVVGFLALGMLRGGIGGSAPTNPLWHSSEFDILFGNAVELARAQANGSVGTVPWALYFADVANLLPQQIAPFVKVEPASWYVNRYYPVYAQMGGGLAFGTMAEAMLTGGWLSAAARGAALGFCFAKVHRLWVRKSHNYWMLVFYVWATTLAYQSFRNTTFALVVLFVFRFLPVFIAVRLLASALRRAAAKARALPAALAVLR